MCLFNLLVLEERATALLGDHYNVENLIGRTYRQQPFIINRSTSGVAEGSVFDPVLFFVYANELSLSPLRGIRRKKNGIFRNSRRMPGPVGKAGNSPISKLSMPLHAEYSS